MNDTNLNKRQHLIIDFLEKRGPSSRLEITQELSRKKPISRITVIRDLNQLKTRGVIEVHGKGKATRYTIRQKNPLLFELDMDNYFDLDIVERRAKQDFNPKVFDNLSELYSRKEKQLWEKSAEVFKKSTKKLDPSIYKRELERFIIELFWKSSQIEGNTYSLIETETLIKQNIEAKGHSKEEAVMILNHKKA